jgi:hypothetical protein
MNVMKEEYLAQVTLLKWHNHREIGLVNDNVHIKLNHTAAMPKHEEKAQTQSAFEQFSGTLCTGTKRLPAHR